MDYLIKGATVVDGTGGPSYVGDVGVRDGKIVAVGRVDDGGVDEEATETYAATGLVVTPGFIDNHTHYDAQLFWDPLLTPSNEHGVTTVLGGNCGFTLAPLKAEDADYIRRMMQKVEGMPLEALETGVNWTWESFGEYLDAVERADLAVNAGFLVGHCAIRRYVMGAEATDREATDDEIKQLVSVLHESIEAGGLGFSTTLSRTHSDGEGKPVASRMAGKDELLALCTAVGEHEGTFLEGIVSGCLDKFEDSEIDLLAEMSAAANRSLNWNLLTIDSREPDRIPRQLQASTRARELGGRVVALTMPVLVPMNMSLLNFCGLWLIPGWGEILQVPVPERMERLADPATRARMVELVNSPEAGVFKRLGSFGRYVIGDTFSDANAGLKGRVVKDIAAERGQEAIDTLLDICIADELRTVLWPMPNDNDPDTWALRQSAWEEPDIMLGGSDAGAHLDRMAGAPFPTRFLGDMIRGRKLVPLESAVRMITGAQADLFGLVDRGYLREGAHADIVVIDPETVASEDASLHFDLPGDAPRLTARGIGVKRVLVNGVETIRDGKATEARPGKVLRSGRDTVTVPTR
ncbi:MAG TPA: amidohydrolase family protein [Mycobacteriales bacterium]|nr:amidohydrolase family protein [Mycobacteriales bacterium]